MFLVNGKNNFQIIFSEEIIISFRNLDFEKLIKQATMDLKLQPEDSFILKVVQLQELYEVRHSVFIVGNAGTGKSQIWKVLNRTYHNQKRKPIAVDLNPKAVTNDELFGIINPSTREWKDGLFSTIMRDLANMTSDGKNQNKNLFFFY
jgi:dynein heavy chain